MFILNNNIIILKINTKYVYKYIIFLKKCLKISYILWYKNVFEYIYYMLMFSFIFNI